MKKALIIMLTFTMIALITACGGSNSGEPVASGSGTAEPVPTRYEADGTERMVSITDFMNMMMCDRGEWTCPAQHNDYALEFSIRQGRSLVNLSDKNATTAKSVNLIGEIGSVAFNEGKNIYCVNLLEYDMPLANKELHIDVSDIGKGIVRAENIYDDCKNVEYIFIADAGDFINGKITDSGTVSIPSANADTTENSEVFGVESQTWVMKDENLTDAYKPLVSLDSAGYFSFKENLYSGMGHMYGMYVDTDTTIECTVYSLDYYGYKGDDVYYIVFEKTSPTTLTLKTDICYSYDGAVFELQ